MNKIMKCFKTVIVILVAQTIFFSPNILAGSDDYNFAASLQGRNYLLDNASKIGITNKEMKIYDDLVSYSSSNSTQPSSNLGALSNVKIGDVNMGDLVASYEKYVKVEKLSASVVAMNDVVAKTNPMILVSQATVANDLSNLAGSKGYEQNLTGYYEYKYEAAGGSNSNRQEAQNIFNAGSSNSEIFSHQAEIAWNGMSAGYSFSRATFLNEKRFDYFKKIEKLDDAEALIKLSNQIFDRMEAIKQVTYEFCVKNDNNKVSVANRLETLGNELLLLLSDENSLPKSIKQGAGYIKAVEEINKAKKNIELLQSLSKIESQTDKNLSYIVDVSRQKIGMDIFNGIMSSVKNIGQGTVIEEVTGIANPIVEAITNAVDIENKYKFSKYKNDLDNATKLLEKDITGAKAVINAMERNIGLTIADADSAEEGTSNASCSLASYQSLIQQGSSSAIGSPSAYMGCQDLSNTAKNNIDPVNPNNNQIQVTTQPHSTPIANASTTLSHAEVIDARGITGTAVTAPVVVVPVTIPTTSTPIEVRPTSTSRPR